MFIDCIIKFTPGLSCICNDLCILSLVNLESIQYSFKEYLSQKRSVVLHTTNPRTCKAKGGGS